MTLTIPAGLVEWLRNFLAEEVCCDLGEEPTSETLALADLEEVRRTVERAAALFNQLGYPGDPHTGDRELVIDAAYAAYLAKVAGADAISEEMKVASGNYAGDSFDPARVRLASDLGAWFAGAAEMVADVEPQRAVGAAG